MLAAYVTSPGNDIEIEGSCPSVSVSKQCVYIPHGCTTCLSCISSIKSASAMMFVVFFDARATGVPVVYSNVIHCAELCPLGEPERSGPRSTK